MDIRGDNMKGIIGAICGDIIGSIYEFDPIKTKEFNLKDSRSFFTDDSVMTLANAEWLINDDYTHDSLVKYMQKLARAYPDESYGNRFRYWIESSNPKPYNSWGNGSAMRVSPVAWAAGNLDETIKLATISAEVTHNHPEGIKGALATATSIFLARTGSSKEDIKEFVENNYEYDLNATVDEIRPRYGFDESCQGTVPEAIICFLDADSYADTIKNAVSLGGDADTLAAIAGSIASAYYEVDDELADFCIEKLDDRLRDILNQFNEKFM